MPFIPNTVDAGFPAQAAPQAWDFDQLLIGHLLTGIQSGCAVTAQGTPDMTVAVAAGVARVNGRKITVAGGNVTIGTAHSTNPRFDLVTVDSSGTKAVVAGTAAATNPVIPATPTGRAALAAVYVPAADTAIQANQIIDKRVTVPVPMMENVQWYWAVGDTDDHNSIERAIAAIGATNAGIIYYPPKVYTTAGGHVLYSRHHHRGSGVQSTILKLRNSANPLALFVGNEFLTRVDGETGGGPLQWSVTHMTLDGNKANQTAVLRSRMVTPTSSTATTGGTLAAATYSYRVVAKNALGTTLASEYVFQVTTGSTSTVTVDWTAVSGATNYQIFGRTWPGTFIVEVGAVTSWIDTGSVTPHATLGSPKHNSSASAGIKVYSYDYVVDDVVVKNFPGEGYFSRWGNLESDGATDTTNWDYMEAILSRMKVHDNGADGFIFDGPHDSYLNNIFSFFNGHEDWSINFDMRGNGFSSSCVNCHGYGNAQYCWKTGGNYQLSSCVGEGAKTAQIQIIGDDLRVWGGQYFAGGAAFPAAVGIAMGTSAYSPKNSLIWGTHLNGFQKPGAAIDFTFMGANCRIFAMIDQNPPTTTLTAAMTNVQTTASVTSGTVAANGDSIVVDNERMLVTAGGGTTTLTVTRAQGGTVGAAHNNGSTVTRYDPAYVGTIDEGADVDLFITGTAQKVTPSFRKFESNVGHRTTDFGFADTTLAFKNVVNAPSVNPAAGAQLYANAGQMWQRGVNGAAPLGSGLSEMTFWTDRTIGATSIAEQGLNVPAALTEWDLTFAGARLVANCDDLGSMLAIAVNFREVAHAGGANSYIFSIRDTSNTANVLATVTVSASGPANFQAVSAWAAKPAWAVGTKTLGLYTSGGDGADDIILRNAGLRWKG